MNYTLNELHHSLITPKEFLHLLAIRWRLWFVPALIVSLAVATYALLSRDTWEASQALIIRNEAANNERGPGKFTQPEEMKAIQETLLELARGRGVLEAVLQQVGPPSDCDHPGSWPNERDIEKFRKAVKLLPPKGAEYGKTEIFYLTLRDYDRGRAITLNEALCARLQAHYQQIRDDKARSMIEELDKTVALAKADLAESTGRLATTEKEIGGDLAELRSMQDIGASDSALRRSAEEIRTQLRETATTAKANRELLAVLRQAQDNPGRLVAAPNRLLESQPGLKKLKDGLVELQLANAKLEGKMTAEHPLVKAAHEAEEEIGRNLHDELALAMRGLEIELRLGADREKLLDEQLAAVNHRLTRLAEIRAEYESQAAENRHRTVLAERAEQNLAEARAALAGAKAASLISCIDRPDAGAKPVAPTRTVIALSGIVAGLIAGLGVFFLALPARVPSFTPEKEITLFNRRSRFPDFKPATSANEHHGRNGHNLRNGNGHLSFKTALEKIHLNGIL